MAEKKTSAVTPVKPAPVTPSLHSDGRIKKDWLDPDIIWRPFSNLGTLWGGHKR